MDAQPLALRLAAALAHATFAASVAPPAVMTFRCAVGADGTDRRRARSWLRYWCVVGPLLALERSAVGRALYGVLTLTGGDARVLGLAVLHFVLAERLACTSLCDDLYESLEAFLAPREGNIRQGLDALGDAVVKTGRRAGVVAATTAADHSRELWRVARCAAAAKRVSDGLRARAADAAARSPGPRTPASTPARPFDRPSAAADAQDTLAGGGAPAAEDELPFEPTPPTPPGSRLVIDDAPTSGYLDDSGDETPTLGAKLTLGSRKKEKRVRFAEVIDDTTPDPPPRKMPTMLGDGISFNDDEDGSFHELMAPPTPQTPSSRFGTLPSGDGVSFCSFADPPPVDPARYAALPSGDGESFCDDEVSASVDPVSPALRALPSGDGESFCDDGDGAEACCEDASDDTGVDIMARLERGTTLGLGGMATGATPCRRRVHLRRGHLQWSAPLERDEGTSGAISLVAVEAVVAVGGRKHRLRVRSATSRGADDLCIDCDARDDVAALREGLEREALEARTAARAVIERQVARMRARQRAAFEKML